MKKAIFFLMLLVIFGCKKKSAENNNIKNQNGNKEYIFNYHEITERIEQNNDFYKLEDYLIPISKNQFIKDSILYKNDLLDNKIVFENGILKTSFGKIKFIVNKNIDSDSFVDYSYIGFNKKKHFHVINIKLYDGELTLLMNDENYNYKIINNTPLFSKNNDYAITYKDNEGLSSSLDLYKIENGSLNKFYIFSSEDNIIESAVWSADNNIIIKAKPLNNDSYKFYKIDINNLKTQRQKAYVNKNFKNDYVLDSALVISPLNEYKIIALEKTEKKNIENVQHNSLPIIIQKKDGGIFKDYVINDQLTFKYHDNCPADGFQRLVSKNNYFTIEQTYCKDFMFVQSYVTFKIENEKIVLYKYGEEYTERSNPEKNINSITKTSKDFGIVKFEDVTEDFLIKLMQK
ncbi:hypothetical protein [Chryseobacterium sp. CFS15]|uniref:hypothetical protein n=1 Tax=Chryseobacterium sp. CFS15 TaxID=2986946 RepID=UPI00280A231C|nr:hypothetical protein [Chryseobacterium sp. CFS15]MDQ8141974.1 hypothetical protein [Chryseobacterium sp. CFS15]